MLTLCELLGEGACAVLQFLLVVALGLAIRRTAKYLAPPPSVSVLQPRKNILPDS